MVSTTTIANQKSDLREMLVWIWLGMLALFFLSAIAMLVVFLFPQQKVVTLGSINEFPPANVPYKVYVAGDKPVGGWLYLVNLDGNLSALDPMTPHITHCLVVWVEVKHRFEDPCSGARFALNGGYLYGPAYSNLSYFPVEINGSGVIQVDTSKTVLETKTQFFERCSEGLKLSNTTTFDDRYTCSHFFQMHPGSEQFFKD